ncbi:MAG: hypothetical protein LBD38_01540, partial [Streptococcaceae bacterium]|nr:hypothetical protein [Streptococcaceae bacterium]
LAFEYLVLFLVTLFFLVYFIRKFSFFDLKKENLTVTRFIEKVTPLTVSIYVVFVGIEVFQNKYIQILEWINDFFVHSQFSHQWGLELIVEQQHNHQIYDLTDGEIERGIFNLPHLSTVFFLKEFLFSFAILVLLLGCTLILKKLTLTTRLNPSKIRLS